MSEVAETLGGRLKAERERKGLSAQKAADDLHLDGWVIDALEGDDYARIGPTVYGKGHLKRYADLLGLPVSEILAAYDTRSTVPAAGAPTATLRMRATDSDAGELPWALVGAAAALVLLVIGAVFLWRPWTAHAVASPAAAEPARSAGSESASPATVQVAEEQPAVNAIPAADAVVGLPSGRDSRTGAASTAAVAPADADAIQGLGKARLRLSFSADSWVDVHDNAGRRLFAGSGRANSVKTIAGDAPLKVYLGFASGVQVEVNSHVIAIGSQFVSGDVARFEAGADGVLRRDAHSSIAGSPRPRG